MALLEIHPALRYKQDRKYTGEPSFPAYKAGEPTSAQPGTEPQPKVKGEEKKYK